MEPSIGNPTGSFTARISACLYSHCWQVFVFIVGMRILVAASLPLSYKEAYFWEWSHFLSFGYLDHPPMVAWVIKTFALWLPDRWPLTIRCGALLFGAATLALVYRVAWQIFGAHVVAARAMILACSVPLLNAVGFLMMPDAPLVFFYLLALSCFVSAVRSERSRDWCLFGAAMGLALLSKLTAVLALLGLVLFLASSREHRSWLKRKEPYIAIAVATTVFSPFLYWNFMHGWASFELLLWDRHRVTFGFGFGKIAEFGAEQLVNTLFLSGPLLVCMCARIEELPGPWRSGYRLLQWQSITTLGVFLLVGAVTETHPHWTLLAYPPAVIALAAWWSSQPIRGLAGNMDRLVPLTVGVVLMIMAMMPIARPIVMDFPAEALGESWAQKIGTARVRMFGWPDLVAQLEERIRRMKLVTDGRDGVIFTDSYRQSALLSYYRDGGLVINVDAYRRKPSGIGDGSWDYLPAEALEGASGIFVTSNRMISSEELRRLFRNVTPLSGIEKSAGGQAIALYSIFRVEGFRAIGARL